MMESLPLGHLKISPGSLEECLTLVGDGLRQGRKAYCIPLNVTKYMVAKRDPKLKSVIKGADLVIADGKPIQWLSWRLGYRDVRHICGIDLAEAILKRSRPLGWRVYLLGARPENLERARVHLETNFGAPLISGARDGYFGKGEIDRILDGINSADPDILLLGLGMPQKEYFVGDFLPRLNARFCLPVGGAFDIWSQAKKRSPRPIRKLGLEWLQRSLYNSQKARDVFRFGFSYLKEMLVIRK